VSPEELVSLGRGEPVLYVVDVVRDRSMSGWALTAKKTESGAVSGNLHYNLAKVNGFVSNSEVTCLSLVGNTAYVGITVLRARIGNADIPLDAIPDKHLILKATDNGEGRAALDDQVSDATFRSAVRDWAGLPEGDCEDPERQAALDGFHSARGLFFTLGAGNVQIIDKR
jgi:hypothetical protein